jgi:hypothetical protein
LFKDVALVVLGLFFMIASFFAKEVRGAFSKLPGPPPTYAQRAIFFLVGLVALIKGLRACIG